MFRFIARASFKGFIHFFYYFFGPFPLIVFSIIHCSLFSHSPPLNCPVIIDLVRGSHLYSCLSLIFLFQMVSIIELLSTLSFFILSEWLYAITDLLATVLIANDVTCLSMRNVPSLDTSVSLLQIYQHFLKNAILFCFSNWMGDCIL